MNWFDVTEEEIEYILAYKPEWSRSRARNFIEDIKFFHHLFGRSPTPQDQT